MKRWSGILVLSVFALAGCKSRAFNAGDGGASVLAWDVERPDWRAADEQAFSDWVKRLGEARTNGQCSTVVDCMAMVGPAGLPAERPPTNIKPDCGRLPFLLRAYFAYRLKLPFSYNRIRSTGDGDIRYSPNGNVVTGQVDQDSVSSVSQFFSSAVGAYFTAYYRVPATTDSNAANAFADTYPVAINHEGVKPGTVYYDPAGHIAIVLSVAADGTIQTWNGHPDGSNTVRPFNQANFPNGPSKSRKFGGFLRFRGWKAAGNRANDQAVPNPAQPAFSMEQYGEWRRGEVVYDDFYKWVRVSLSGSTKINPVEEFKTIVSDLCAKLKDRVKSVQAAVDRGLPRQSHPGLPRNIFGAEGDWESYSTPSGDLRSKLAYMNLYNLVSKSVSALRSNNRAEYDFAGSADQLIAAYREEWESRKESAACTANAQNSNGGAMNITLEMAMKSVFDWSFDPYHCPELRWGILDSSTCNGDATKLEIYRQEAKLRWNTNKDSNAHTDFNFGNNESKPITDFSTLFAGGSAPVANPPPQPEAFPKWCKVQSSDGSANARKGPGTSHAIAKTLNNGAEVKVTRADGAWYSTEFRLAGVDFGEVHNNPAWIFNSLLQCN